MNPENKINQKSFKFEGQSVCSNFVKNDDQKIPLKGNLTSTGTKNSNMESSADLNGDAYPSTIHNTPLKFKIEAILDDKKPKVTKKAKFSRLKINSLESNVSSSPSVSESGESESSETSSYKSSPLSAMSDERMKNQSLRILNDKAVQFNCFDNNEINIKLQKSRQKLKNCSQINSEIKIEGTPANNNSKSTDHSQLEANPLSKKMKFGKDLEFGDRVAAETSRIEKNGKKKKIVHSEKKNYKVADAYDEEDQHFDAGMTALMQRNRSDKSKLVARLLCRWWYAYDDWPPENFDFNAELTKRKIKHVSLEEWEDAEDVDANGFTKVYQISAFPGVFRDPSGNAIDLRPKDSCPSYRNFIKKSEFELLEALQRAYKNQIKSLEQSQYDETQLKKKLSYELGEINALLMKQKYNPN